VGGAFTTGESFNSHVFVGDATPGVRPDMSALYDSNRVADDSSKQVYKPLPRAQGHGPCTASGRLRLEERALGNEDNAKSADQSQTLINANLLLLKGSIASDQTCGLKSNPIRQG
jgi:hypothetical protein